LMPGRMPLRSGRNTVGPWNGPPAWAAIEVWYIGTLQPRANVTQFDASAISASSK
jgi:hypothetical protein